MHKYTLLILVALLSVATCIFPEGTDVEISASSKSKKVEPECDIDDFCTVPGWDKPHVVELSRAMTRRSLLEVYPDMTRQEKINYFNAFDDNLLVKRKETIDSIDACLRLAADAEEDQELFVRALGHLNDDLGAIDKKRKALDELKAPKGKKRRRI